MTTSHLACFSPRFTVSKFFWIRINRVLAWSLIVSPFAQWALHMPLMTALAMNMALLAAHALMSFMLFGRPQTKTRVFSAGMHVLGFAPTGLSERNRFLLSGYRIALGYLPVALMYSPFKYDVLVTAIVLLYPLLRLPVSVIQHTYLGVRYALRRWGVRASASTGAAAIVAAYLFAYLARSVW